MRQSGLLQHRSRTPAPPCYPTVTFVTGSGDVLMQCATLYSKSVSTPGYAYGRSHAFAFSSRPGLSVCCDFAGVLRRRLG